jgi:hypothetical protein
MAISARDPREAASEFVEGNDHFYEDLESGGPVSVKEENKKKVSKFTARLRWEPDIVIYDR